MKLLVASDIHGSQFYAEKLASRIDKEMVDEVVLLGDLYYHGPRNPLPKDYNPMAVCDILNNYKDKTVSAKGNCDAEVDIMISKFPCHTTIRKTIHGKRYMFTHGHVYNVDNPPANIDILVHGHTHVNGILCCFIRTVVDLGNCLIIVKAIRSRRSPVCNTFQNRFLSCQLTIPYINLINSF